MNRYIALQKIVELGSFTKAAKTLGYTQSSISQMIVSLEEELSIKLLYRSRTGVKLTLEGADLYPYIERSIREYKAVGDKANEIRGLDTGTVRVGTLSSVTCNWMPLLLRDFEKKYPNVEFVFLQGDYVSIQEWIKTGAVDFGFVTPAAVSGLQTIDIKTGEMLAIVPKKHKLAGRDFIELWEIADEPYILLEEGNYSEPLNAFEAQGIAPKIKYTIHDDYAIMTMVEQGLGVSILAELVLKRRTDKIVCLPINPPIYRPLAIAYKNKNSLPIAAKYFINHITENIDILP
ncbi:MAG: LysR family transcriptional regulator [Clostridiales bacterium]|nr:LysR family transcriptional regulator [Clostridiales bacterium]